MKAKTLYKIFFIVLCAIGLFGCSVPTPDPAPKPHVPTPSQIVVSGTINADNGRSATVDLNKLDLTWYVIATQEKVPTETDPKATVTGKTFSLVLPNEGDWVIYAGGFAGQPDRTYQNFVIGGTKEIPVTKTGVTGIVISASPASNASGAISLSFSAAVSTGITKVYMKDISDIDTSADFTEGSATINLNAVSSGDHIVTLTFTDKFGNDLYHCKEAIKVYGGLTTNKWVGKNGSFTVTQEMINGYGTDIVPDTGIVLYDNWCDENFETTHRYYFSNISSPIIDESWGEGNESDMPPISFTFDNAGNLYVLNKSGEDTETADLYTEIKTNFGSAETKTITISDIDFKSITIDRKTNTLYGSSFYSDAEIPMLNLYAYPTIISANNTDDMIHYVVADNILNYYGDIFAINDGKVYIPCLTSNEETQMESYSIVLAKATLNKNNKIELQDIDPYYSVSVTDSVDVTLNDITLDSTMQLTDCIYQDGCVYMLLRESRTYWDASDVNMYSRGAVIKYDCFDGSITTLGWSNNKIENTNINNMYLVDSNNNSVYSDEEQKNLFLLSKTEVFNSEYNPDKLCGELFPTVYAPNSAEGKIDDQHFYGPQKFVAIKPKKLVIFDDGVAIYTDDDALTFKNVNRIITINLEDFAMSSANPNVTFNDDFNVLKPYSNINSLGASGFNPGDVYWDDKGEYDTAADLYLAIPKATN